MEKNLSEHFEFSAEVGMTSCCEPKPRRLLLYFCSVPYFKCSSAATLPSRGRPSHGGAASLGWERCFLLIHAVMVFLISPAFSLSPCCKTNPAHCLHCLPGFSRRSALEARTLFTLSASPVGLLHFSAQLQTTALLTEQKSRDPIRRTEYLLHFLFPSV